MAEASASGASASADGAGAGASLVLLARLRRGAPGVKDEPQHLVQGKQMRPILAALGIQQ